MSQQHTPGPWTHVQRPNGLIHILTADLETAIAIVPKAGDFTNAHLLAAAPELLAALEALIRPSSGHLVNCLAGIRTGDGCRDICASAKAAIATARGLEDS